MSISQFRERKCFFRSVRSFFSVQIEDLKELLFSDSFLSGLKCSHQRILLKWDDVGFSFICTQFTRYSAINLLSSHSDNNRNNLQNVIPSILCLLERNIWNCVTKISGNAKEHRKTGNRILT
jgi:hypothetical protein